MPPPFTCECWRCGTEFTRDFPVVFCDGCVPGVVRQMEEARMEYLATPGAIWPGDTVRYKDPRQMAGVPRSDDVR